MRKRGIKTSISSVIMRQNPEFHALLNCRDLGVICYLDKLAIHVDQLDEAFLKSQCQLLFKFSASKYSGGFSYQAKTGLQFQVFKNCTAENAQFFHKIQIRPGDIDFDVLMSTFGKIMGHPLSAHNHAIARLDIAYVVKESYLSPKVLYMISVQKWKRSHSAYHGERTDYMNGHMTGFHSNGGGVRSSIYSETAKKQATGRCRHHGHVKAEFQLKKKVLSAKGIFSLFDLYKIPGTNLYKRLSFYDPLRIYSPKKKKKAKLKKFKEFQFLVLAEGFTNAKKRLNQQRNFERDYLKGLLREFRINKGKTKLADVFSEAFESWFHQWLGLDFVAKCRRMENRELKKIKK